MSVWDRRLGEAREKWAARPELAAPPLPGPAPSWLEASDRLYEIRLAQERLYTQGVLTWAHVLMANEFMWRPDADDAPGDLLLSRDPALQANPSGFAPIAQRFWAVKEAGSLAAAGYRALVDAYTDEYQRHVMDPMSRLVTGGRVIYRSTVLFHHAQLPGNKLAAHILPAAVIWGPRPAVMALPAAFWPDNLAARWTAA